LDDIKLYSEFHGSRNTIQQSFGQLIVSGSNQTIVRHTVTSQRSGLGLRTPTISSHCLHRQVSNTSRTSSHSRNLGRRSRKVFRHATISRLAQRRTRQATFSHALGHPSRTRMQSSQSCLWNSRRTNLHCQKNSKTLVTYSASRQQTYYRRQPSTIIPFRSRRIANLHLVLSTHSQKTSSRLWMLTSRNTSPNISFNRQPRQQERQSSLSRNRMVHSVFVSIIVDSTRLPSRIDIPCLYLSI